MILIQSVVFGVLVVCAAFQARSGGSKWLRVAAGATFVFLPVLLLPAAGCLAAGGILLLLLLPLVCFLLSVAILCFIPVAVSSTRSFKDLLFERLWARV